MTKEGIVLDPVKLEAGKNEGLRMIAKIMLNSLWGKFGQKANNNQIVITDNDKTLRLLCDDPTVEVLDFEHINKVLDRIVIKSLNIAESAPKTNNLPIAACVTSYARLHLYRYLNMVIENDLELLYCDTDSIIYVLQKNGIKIPEGSFLGEMSVEFEDRKITEFICGGPKNYGLKHKGTPNDVKTMVKIRGFELNFNALTALNYKKMRKMVLKHFL